MTRKKWEELDHNTKPETDLRRALGTIDEFGQSLRNELLNEVDRVEQGEVNAGTIEELEHGIDSLEKALRRIKHENKVTE